MAQIKIIQHNVRKWSTNKHSLDHAYQQEYPEIILINSHGAIDNENIKIFNYNIHQICIIYCCVASLTRHQN